MTLRYEDIDIERFTQVMPLYGRMLESVVLSEVGLPSDPRKAAICAANRAKIEQKLELAENWQAARQCWFDYVKETSFEDSDSVIMKMCIWRAASFFKKESVSSAA